MEIYTKNEKIDMLLIYGEARKNSYEACVLYAQRFPDRRHPTRHYFPKLEQKMRNEPDEEREKFIISEDKEIDVLAYVEQNFTSSTREIANECNISPASVWRILRKHKYRSYKYQLHQHLYENDYERRLEYCNWFLGKLQDDPNFPSKIIYSDESRFTNLGLFNRNNKRYWSQENLHLMTEGNFQERFGFNCWLGVIGDRILGPIIFEGHLTGERYLNFLENEIDQLIDNLPLANYVDIFFQQDGAPPHNTREVTRYLNTRFGQQWIGNGGPIRWPARYFFSCIYFTFLISLISHFYLRSPDLTPLDFFIWGTIKDEVYDTPSATQQELEAKVRAAIARISPQQLRNTVRATVEKITFCRDQQGGHFEHLER